MKNISKSLILLFSIFCLELSAQKLQPDMNHISLPDEDWDLALNLDGFEVSKNSVSADGKAREILVGQENSLLNVSVFIEEADHAGDAIACRKFYWAKAEKSPLPKQNLKLYENNGMAFVEHDTKEYQGQKVNYHSMNIYLSKGTYWIDVHISKMSYKPEDQILFDNIVNSIKIESPKTKNETELFIFASQFFYQRNYKAAAKCYEPLLTDGRESFGKDLWRAIVDNLGMSYGLSGDLQNSKRVYEDAIKVDSNYPNFYYSLACTYAEMSDLDNTLKNLDLAFQNRSNVIDGEGFPDPKEDPSFKKYLKNDSFKKLLKKYN